MVTAFGEWLWYWVCYVLDVLRYRRHVDRSRAATIPRGDISRAAREQHRHETPTIATATVTTAKTTAKTTATATGEGEGIFAAGRCQEHRGGHVLCCAVLCYDDVV